jgi:hypothetical protein
MDDDAAARLRWEDDEIDDSDDGLRELATKFTREEMELAEQAAAAKPRSAAAAAAAKRGDPFATGEDWYVLIAHVLVRLTQADPALFARVNRACRFLARRPCVKNKLSVMYNNVARTPVATFSPTTCPSCGAT